VGWRPEEGAIIGGSVGDSVAGLAIAGVVLVGDRAPMADPAHRGREQRSPGNGKRADPGKKHDCCDKADERRPEGRGESQAFREAGHGQAWIAGLCQRDKPRRARASIISADRSESR
jgi:hypothetical protein